MYNNTNFVPRDARAREDGELQDLRPHLTDRFGVSVGGGEGYSDWVIKYDVMVRNRSELLDALANASSGTHIYVDDDARIQLLEEDWGIPIPGGVTLASGRGRNGSLGGLIFTNSTKSKSLFRVSQPNVRVTGLRLRGPFTGIDGPDCGGNDAVGIALNTKAGELVNLNFTLDNCELWGWPHSPIYANSVLGIHIHHNHIHHNRRQERTSGCRHYGLGYGVRTDKGYALIEYNLFDHNRHDIASSGLPGSSYTARRNWSVEGLVSHSFDMHGCPDRPDHPECKEDKKAAGESLDIYDNIFMQSSREGFVIRGIPPLRLGYIVISSLILLNLLQYAKLIIRAICVYSPTN